MACNPTNNNIVYPPNSSYANTFARHESLLTPVEMRKRFLFGVEFLDKDGNQIDERIFNDALGDAISQFEHEFNIPIQPVQFIDYKDYHWVDYSRYCYLQLNHKPIISIDSVEIEFTPGQPTVQVPNTWIRAYKEAGQLQLVATSGSLAQFNIGNSALLPRVLGGFGTYPQLFKVTYTAGFEKDKIPKIINNYIGLQAAIDLLSIAGDLIIAPGISSQTISLDGLSQTLNSTLSAENSGYGGRVRQYNEQLTETRKIISKFYRGISFIVA